MSIPHFFKTLLLLILLGLTTASSALAADAAAYAISDSTTGVILEESNGTKKLQIGSLTKIATAMVVLDWAASKGSGGGGGGGHRSIDAMGVLDGSASKGPGGGDLGGLASIPDSALPIATPEGVGFQPGDSCSLRDLLYAALMQSDNVAAATLADHVGRALGGGNTAPVVTFVAQMNALARKLGMTRTRFINPHGLDRLESTVPYSTAEDLSKLTAYAMANSAFRFYVSQKERKISILGGPSGQREYLLRNTNQLLGVNDIDGVKTGATARAGQCVIISAAKAPESRQQGEVHIVTPRRLNVVVLGAPKRFDLAVALLNHGWRLYDSWSAAGRPAQWKSSR
jgi:D-alanyl-D-alanine carboxypeptidase (penicillin-binding protein 5/6)